MQLNLTSATGDVSGDTVELSEVIFGISFNESLVHQVVTAYLAGGRAGTHSQKTRAEVRGGGAKPWRQKGTGRARAGTIRSPIWRGGGKAFAASRRDYSQKVNKKMYRSALRSILSELVRQERLIVVAEIGVSEPKTKELLSTLTGLGLDQALIITDKLDLNLALAARNLRNVAVEEATTVDPVSLIRYEKVLATTEAVKQLEERLG